jgi:hypothetical protein
LPDYLVLIYALGGISVFALDVIVVWPVIAAMFITTWDIFLASRHEAESDNARILGLGLLDDLHDHEQDRGPDEGEADGVETNGQRDADQVGHKQGPKDADDDVSREAEAGSSHQATREPADYAAGHNCNDKFCQR